MDPAGFWQYLELFPPEQLRKIAKEHAPLVHELLEWLRKELVSATIKSIAEYCDDGFSKEEAILLTVNNRLALEMADKRLRQQRRS